jgi:hypothetical protein
MTRKLRNSLNALLLTSAVCALGAVSTAALPFDAGRVEQAAATTVAKTVGMDAVAEPVARRKAGTFRRMRPSAGMPYFSFVPRG